MRTALLTWDMPPVPTGLGRAADEIARGLLEAGVDVTVFSADRSGREVVDGLTIVGCEPSRLRSVQRRFALVGHHAMPAVFARAVAREQSRAPFDLVEATNWYAPGAAVRQPLVVRCSTPAIDAADPAASPRDRLDLAYADRLEGRTARRARAVISNTQPHAGKMRELYRLRPEQPHETIGLSLAREVIEEGRRLSWPPADAPGVLFVGRAERRKGFAEALAGFALWRERHPRATLRIVGLAPGDLDPVPQGVVDLGRASDAAMREAMAASQIVLAPSRYESYGLVYREAAAAGRALVASREDPSATDYIGATAAGILAAKTAPAEIADALEDAWRSREVLRANGLAHARTLSRGALGKATADLYERVLTGA